MRILTFLLAMLAPMPALALSCVSPSVERTFHEVVAAPELYVIVHGRLMLDTGKLPRAGTTNSNPPKMTKVEARIKGRSLSEAGFATPFDRTLTLEVGCVGPWCGSVANEEYVLAFVRKGADGYSLSVSPCGGHVFGAPKKAMLKKVKQCYNGGACAAR